MALDWNDLKVYARAGANNDALLERCWNLAKVEVDDYLSGVRLVDSEVTIPLEVIDECYLQVAVEHLDRTRGPANPGQLIEGGVQLRVNRDPLTPVYPLISRWVVPF